MQSLVFLDLMDWLSCAFVLLLVSMETDGKGPSNCTNKPSADLDSQKVELDVNGEENEESNSLLSPRRGGMSKKPRKSRRKVQWNDKNGNKLVEVLEFQPSDSSDSEDDDDNDDESDSCICTIM